MHCGTEKRTSAQSSLDLLNLHQLASAANLICVPAAPVAVNPSPTAPTASRIPRLPVADPNMISPSAPSSVLTSDDQRSAVTSASKHKRKAPNDERLSAVSSFSKHSRPLSATALAAAAAARAQQDSSAALVGIKDAVVCLVEKIPHPTSTTIQGAIQKLDQMPQLSAVDKAILADEFIENNSAASGFLSMGDTFINEWVQRKLEILCAAPTPRVNSVPD